MAEIEVTWERIPGILHAQPQPKDGQPIPKAPAQKLMWMPFRAPRHRMGSPTKTGDWEHALQLP